ncbi:MAG TPA: cytochrome c maturation protein CcmE [Dehalococcoidales bacterium]
MRRKKFLIGGIVILVAIGALGFIALRGAATYYYTVSEILSKSSTLNGQTIRVAGPVAVNSLQQVESTGNSVEFVMQDRDNSQFRLTINYQGSLPDAFKEGQDAVVEGQLTSTGDFAATQIIVKCPSKYQPQGQNGN